MQPGKAIDFCTVTATARGDLSKNSFGRRKSTGIGLFAFLGKVSHDFRANRLY